MNASEQFVYNICQRSFLSLWSYRNPKGNQGKELCDLLVVCDPHVIVLSVKEVQLKRTADFRTASDRWQRKAVEDSVKQIKGAIRWLDRAQHVVQKNGHLGVPLPIKDRRIYHRIAVAFGGQREVFIQSGKAGEPFVHVLDEESFYLLLRHLDTITDFVDYLGNKEQLLAQSRVVINGGEENLLALYLQQGRTFPRNQDLLIIEDDMWPGVSAKPEFAEKVERDRDSYVWDLLIEHLCSGGFQDDSWQGPGLTESEQVLRVLARENRFGRRILGRTFKEFLELSKAGKVRSRCFESLNSIGYVFFAYDVRRTDEERRAELVGRCFASLLQLPDCSTIIGIGINVPGQLSTAGYATIIAMLQSKDGIWTKDDINQAVFFRDECGYFKDPSQVPIHEDEYPVNRTNK
jgi:hypothetical protein